MEESNSPILCPRCQQFTTSSPEAFVHHFNSVHFLQCPKCYQTGFVDGSQLIEHVEINHVLSSELQNVYVSQPQIACPKCDCPFSKGAKFVQHLEQVHQFTAPQHDDIDGITDNRKLPTKGDKIIAMWGQSMWQYFHATIVSFDADTLRYTIDWDDGDTTGRVVDYFNIALDRVPKQNEIGVGSIVLFPQGQYKAGQTQLTGGKRWHQGRITSMLTMADGQKLYSGCHTKGGNDGKFVTYKGYEYEFLKVPLEDLRVAPNVFDIVNSDASNDAENDIGPVDVYISYSLSDSLKAIREGHVVTPSNYEGRINDMCDPEDIVDYLRSQDVKVYSHAYNSSDNMRKMAQVIKKAKVFVACISSEYVSSDQCRMEFQYAKTTLRKPVVPLVVGDGSFNWTFSVVGLLIAGELYIHFRNPSVMETKQQELMKTLETHLQMDVSSPEEMISPSKMPADVFISYCWTNSFLAEQASQIKKVSGTSFADPRLLKSRLEQVGLTCWLDIERLQSAEANSGLFDQLTNGILAAKVVVPCISDEYARSPNCRMEYQFALKSLGKPVVPVVVGTGDEWKETVVGALISTHDQEPVDLRFTESSDVFAEKLQQIKLRIDSEAEAIQAASPLSVKAHAKKSKARGRSKAPQVGDHVVCHHFDWTYYMATVVSYDTQRMEYTVNWDDGDPSGRVQPYNQVALDKEPEVDDIGVGSIIFFPQGRYVGTEGNNTGGVRYHEGVITKVDRQANNETFVSGHHTKTESDGKFISRSYVYEFFDIPLNMVRIAPTALDAAMNP